MQADEVKYVKRHVLLGTLDVHPTEKALVVNYELEATLVGELGDTMLEETKECQKIIRVKSLNEATDLKSLAKGIVEKCPLIPPSRLHEVEQLLYYIQTRKISPAAEVLEVKVNGLEKDNAYEGSEINEVANISHLDSYIELLYENTPEKIRASALVLQLARNADNLCVLSSNEILLGALARVLREDGRKSIDLSTNIVYIFFCFSAFTQLHHVVAQYKIGSLCMDLVEYELKRYDMWAEEMAKKKSIVELEKSNAAIVKEYEKNFKRHLALVKKQDQLLQKCFYLLLNITEDAKVEMKVVNRGVIPLLIKCLHRELPALLIVVVSFLKKLSIYIENKTEMEENNITENIAHLVPNANEDLLNVVLHLLQNLSFDLELRNVMIKCGFLPKLVNLISSEAHQNVVWVILYHLSMDDRCKSLFTYTDCIPHVTKLILECPEEKVPLNLVAFLINLAVNKRNAQLICEGNRLKLLWKRALKFQDSLLVKAVRNISQHDGPTKLLFLDFVDSIGDVIHRSDGRNDEFLVECLGILGNLTIPDLDYEKIALKYDLIDWMIKKLEPDACADDIILEVIIMAGTFASDEICASMILESGMLKLIIDLLNAKQEDDEIVLQIVYLFHQLICHSSTRNMIIKETQIPAYLTDLMHDKNAEIRKLCDISLDIVAAFDEEWAKKIQMEKFRWHNCHWLEMVDSQQMEEGDFYMEDQFGPYIQETDILDRSDLLYTSGAYESLLSDDSLSPDILEDLPSNQSTENNSCRPKSRYKNRYNSKVE